MPCADLFEVFGVSVVVRLLLFVGLLGGAGAAVLQHFFVLLLARFGRAVRAWGEELQHVFAVDEVVLAEHLRERSATRLHFEVLARAETGETQLLGQLGVVPAPRAVSALGLLLVERGVRLQVLLVV